MTDQEILTKAIQRALDNGWKLPFEESVLGFIVTQEDVEGTYQTEPYIRFELDSTHDWCVGVEKIIYNHDFAKALWGNYIPKPPKYVKDRKTMKFPARPLATLPGAIFPAQEYELNLDRIEYDFGIGGWQYHLQQMVITDNPIQYLAKALEV